MPILRPFRDMTNLPCHHHVLDQGLLATRQPGAQRPSGEARELTDAGRNSLPPVSERCAPRHQQDSEQGRLKAGRPLKRVASPRWAQVRYPAGPLIEILLNASVSLVRSTRLGSADTLRNFMRCFTGVRAKFRILKVDVRSPGAASGISWGAFQAARAR